MSNKKIKKMDPKYIRRRFLLSVVVLAVLGIGIWQVAVRLMPGQPEPDEAAETQNQENSGESALDDEAEPNQPEPEPEPDLEPEAGEAWELLLVNQSRPLPENFDVQLVVAADSYRVDARIADAVRRMFMKAKEDGINLMICSAYRSPEYQQGLFEQQVAQQKGYGLSEEEAVTAAATVVAVPGTSEHHTGLALDIVTPTYQVLDDGYEETPAAKWLAGNAWEYGFILRYPKDKQEITKIIFEPWHYRYVGEEHAKIIHEKGYCLEEYLYIELRGDGAGSQEQEPGTEENKAGDTA